MKNQNRNKIFNRNIIGKKFNKSTFASIELNEKIQKKKLLLIFLMKISLKKVLKLIEKSFLKKKEKIK